MTTPYLMNCPHSSDGWCLDCVKELYDESEKRSEFINKYLHNVNPIVSKRCDKCSQKLRFQNKLSIIRCGICGNSFARNKYPDTGDSITCSHCGAEGYGTYDQNGLYMLEWYESEN